MLGMDEAMNGSLSISSDDQQEDDYNFDQQYPEEVTSSLDAQNTSIPSTARQLSSRMGTASRNAPMLPSRMGTSSMITDSTARPMTSIGSANYNARPPSSQGLPNGSRGAAPPLVKKSTTSIEAITKELEKKVNLFIEESAIASQRGDLRLGLEKAKDALKKEKQLSKHREQNGIEANFDLTYAVYFCLANQYHKNGLHQEALNTFNMIVKNKQYAQGARMRVNMGNIYMEQKKYNEAIKNYRMASDQIPNTSKEMRFKVMRNIGNAFVALGNFQSAVQTFEAVMEGNPDFPSCFNLILCYYSIGNKEKMKTVFMAMLKIRSGSKVRDGENPEDQEDPEEFDDSQGAANLPNDTLRQEMREQQRKEDRIIILAAKLIAPVIEKDFATGFDYIVETLRATQNNDLANELEISKALTFMKKRDIQKAIETLKEFEKKDQAMAGAASTNLSFLYFLEKDYKNAEKYANLALKNDPYSAKAFVNKGNCCMVKGKLEDAKDLFQEALSCESDCIEALYNLGLVNKKMELPDKAFQYFKKLNQMVPNHPEIIFQIASLCEQLGHKKEAEDTYKSLIAIVPSDPTVLQRMGSIVNEQDDILAQSYYMDSYRYFPADLNVLSWLGAYYSRSEAYERAIQFFQRGAQLEPFNAKWRLLVAGCYRKLRNYSQAKELYEDILKKHPDHVESLRHLVTICNDLGYKDQVDQYVARLRKVEQSGGSQDNSEELLESKPRPPIRQLSASSRDSRDDDDYSSNRKDSAKKSNVIKARMPPREQHERETWSYNDKDDDGPIPPRPGTAGIKKKITSSIEDDFGDDMIQDEMLPL